MRLNLGSGMGMEINHWEWEGMGLIKTLPFTGAQLRFQSWGPAIPWFRISFYKKIRQVFLVWCSRLHNHTLVIKTLCKKLGVRPNFGEVRIPPTPRWLRPCPLVSTRNPRVATGQNLYEKNHNTREWSELMSITQ